MLSDIDDLISSLKRLRWGEAAAADPFAHPPYTYAIAEGAYASMAFMVTLG